MKRNIFIIAIVMIVSTINVVISIVELKEISNIFFNNIESLASVNDNESKPQMTKCYRCNQYIKITDTICPYCSSTNYGYSSNPTYNGKGVEKIVPGSQRTSWKGSRMVVSMQVQCTGDTPSNCIPGLKEV